MKKLYCLTLSLVVFALFSTGCMTKRKPVKIVKPLPDQIEDMEKGAPSPSALQECSKEYGVLESKYIYPDFLDSCYSRQANVDLYFSPENGFTKVDAFVPGTENRLYSANYGDNKEIERITYYDLATDNFLKAVTFTPGGAVENITDYERTSGNTSKFVSYYQSGSVESLQLYNPETKNRTDYYSYQEDGTLKKVYILNENGTLNYSFEYDSAGKPVQIVKYNQPEPMQDNQNDKANFFGTFAVNAMRMASNMMPLDVVNFNPDGSVKEASSYKWNGIAMAEYKYYRADGKVTIFKCISGDCLRFNATKPWSCSEGEQPCSEKFKGYGALFQDRDLSKEAVFIPAAGTLNAPSGLPKVCDIMPEAFQCRSF